MRTYMHSLAVCFVLFCSFSATSALAAPITNGGPGGFTPLNVASDLQLWLKADAVNQGDNTAVSTWGNSAFTGASHNAVQVAVNGNPVLRTGILGLPNDQPVVRFDGTQRLVVQQNVYDGTRNATFFNVGRTAITPSGSDSIGRRLWTVRRSTQDGFGGGSYSTIGMQGTTLQHGYNPSTTSLTFVNTGSTLATTDTFLSTLRQATSSSTAQTFRDGTLVHTQGSFALAPLNSGPDSHLFIGTGASGNDRNWNGDMSEIIMFRGALNITERTIVENHLSAKYDVGIANSFYTGKSGGLGDYDRDVFGIGQALTSGQITTSGMGGFGIEERNSTISEGEFIFAGHRVQNNTLVDFEGNPNLQGETSGERWDRVWYVDTNDSDVDVTLSFNFIDAGLALPNSGDTLSLLYSSTSNFEWELLSLDAVDLGGGLFTFDLAAADLLNGYYTLGVNAVQAVPEPASLALLACGLACVMGRRRRTRANYGA